MSEISADNAQFLDAAVARGDFPSREAALDQAVSLLRERQRVFDRFVELVARLPSPPAVLERRPRGVFWIRGHRISLHLLLEYILAGERAEDLARRFPTVEPAALGKVVHYAHRNQNVLRAYAAAGQACSRMQESESRPSAAVEEIRARFAVSRQSST